MPVEQRVTLIRAVERERGSSCEVDLLLYSRSLNVYCQAAFLLARHLGPLADGNRRAPPLGGERLLA